MSYSNVNDCLKCSLTLLFLLFLQIANAQNSFKRTDDWIINNLHSLGGRAVLVIFKDGKIIYNHSQNKLSPTQKVMLNVSL